MRERHNIVGSEVGQPRPPVYLRAPEKIHRARFPVFRALLVAVLATLFAASLLLQIT